MPASFTVLTRYVCSICEANRDEQNAGEMPDRQILRCAACGGRKPHYKQSALKKLDESDDSEDEDGDDDDDA